MFLYQRGKNHGIFFFCLCAVDKSLEKWFWQESGKKFTKRGFLLKKIDEWSP